MKTALILTLTCLIAVPALAGQTVTVTSKDGKVTKQVVTTTTETVELDAATVSGDLADAKTKLSGLQALADIDITDRQALDLFYYLERLPFAQKSTLKATLSAEIAVQDDLVKKLEAVIEE